MSRRPPLQPELFGPAPPPPDDTRKVTIPMRLLTQTDRAYHLAPGLAGSAKSAWIPKRICARGAPPDDGRFTLTRAAAKERGWL